MVRSLVALAPSGAEGGGAMSEERAFLDAMFRGAPPVGPGGEFRLSTDRGGPNDKTAHTIAEHGFHGGCVKIVAFICHNNEARCDLCTLTDNLNAATREGNEVADAVGALEDAGVRRNDGDDIASGIETLAKDRDELLAEWNAVGSIFWPDRDPDDGWSHHEIADEVKGLRERAEAREVGR